MRVLLVFLLIVLNFPVCAQDAIEGSQSPKRANPFAALPDPNEPVTYTNPVIPGFYSDPSVCRVGEDYYLVTSTFEYFPGVPVFHSKDLVNWEQIGHCIHRREQLPHGINIFAATLRHHKGTFYMITTNVANGGNFYVTASNPAGPWSDPIYVDVPGIDPDLFFDDDGKAYVISSPFILYEIDLATGKLLTEGRKVWNGTGGRYAEGPHLYKKDGFYYLMGAEGGTEEAHSETIARSHSVWGPYTDNPANPILAHANAAGQGNPIQGVGHADMINAHDGSRWMVFHGYRNIADVSGGVHHILGRETCLAPVDWPKNGWPVVNGNGTVNVNMTVPTLPLKPFSKKSGKVEFDTPKLGLEWNYIQLPEESNYQLDAAKGVLHLKGSDGVIGDHGSPTFVGRRLQHLHFTATTLMEFDPKKENEEAGMILLNNGSHFDLLVHRKNGKRLLVVKLQFGSTTYTSEAIELKPGPVQLRVTGERTSFTFSYAQENGVFKDVETVDAKFLGSEVVGWFTGVYVGLYATGNGKKSKEHATYDWFEYEGH
ncbi:glycoside hydrolase family 43 protein [Maribacter sp. ANRC-HE7]|uniref:Glycoside hydrolase family 43 protein n=1 Tax=Maribacter aquimaris TaxID=2737171 RepID=A0ABR7V8Z9_9FLAO|nr:glycoside hydrolase family 43 protein [Maribacter aquimaris]MBD0779628.1 glycoside hydrolase family 43 protein [Maribacter aquimaris]